MALPAFASLDDYEVRYGSVDDPTRAQAALDRASTLIRVEAGTSWVTDGELDWGDVADYLQDEIIHIAVEVAHRALDTPEGGIKSETVGDESVTYANPHGDFYLRATEKASIRRAAGRRGVYTIGTTRTETTVADDLGVAVDATGTIYAEVAGGADVPWLAGPEIE